MYPTGSSAAKKAKQNFLTHISVIPGNCTGHNARHACPLCTGIYHKPSARHQTSLSLLGRHTSRGGMRSGVTQEDVFGGTSQPSRGEHRGVSSPTKVKARMDSRRVRGPAARLKNSACSEGYLLSSSCPYSSHDPVVSSRSCTEPMIRVMQPNVEPFPCAMICGCLWTLAIACDTARTCIVSSHTRMCRDSIHVCITAYSPSSTPCHRRSSLISRVSGRYAVRCLPCVAAAVESQSYSKTLQKTI